jgi:hypothetical protein
VSVHLSEMNLEQTKSAAYEGVAAGIGVVAQQWRPRQRRGRRRRCRHGGGLPVAYRHPLDRTREVGGEWRQ